MTTDLPLLTAAAPPPGEVHALTVREVCGAAARDRADAVAVEEPLEIRLGCDRGGRRAHHPVSVTMRTPGHDDELAVGFLFTEGIIPGREAVAGVRPCGSGNVVRVDLKPGVSVEIDRLERHFYTASS